MLVVWFTLSSLCLLTPSPCVAPSPCPCPLVITSFLCISVSLKLTLSQFPQSPIVNAGNCSFQWEVVSGRHGKWHRATMAKGISCFACYFSVSLSLCYVSLSCPEPVKCLGIFACLQFINTLQVQWSFLDMSPLEKQVKPGSRLTAWFPAKAELLKEPWPQMPGGHHAVELSQPSALFQTHTALSALTVLASELGGPPLGFPSLCHCSFSLACRAFLGNWLQGPFSPQECFLCH